MLTPHEIRFRVTALHTGINQLVAGNITASETSSQERIDIVISALTAALAEAIVGLNVDPHYAAETLRVQLGKLRQ